jgi:two-component system C4-dicarboxylate transport response regulator DctD
VPVTLTARDVLCVEDDPDIARVLQLMIEAVPGHRAVLAQDAGSALELVDAGRLPGLAFIDLGLPDMDGIELVRQLRERRPDLRIIVVTAYHERRGEAFAAGASAFLGKPFDPDQVVHLVEQHGE